MMVGCVVIGTPVKKPVFHIIYTLSRHGPGVAGAALQTESYLINSLIHSVRHPLPPLV